MVFIKCQCKLFIVLYIFNHLINNELRTFSQIKMQTQILGAFGFIYPKIRKQSQWQSQLQ